VYEKSLVHELIAAGLQIQAQYPISVFYKGKVVGNFFADILVEKFILVELKASNLNLCLLLNFGKPKVEIKRIVRNL
jgi:GxxExxY protein